MNIEQKRELLRKYHNDQAKYLEDQIVSLHKMVHLHKAHAFGVVELSDEEVQSSLTLFETIRKERAACEAARMMNSIKEKEKHVKNE